MKFLREFAASLMLLTRLPVWRLHLAQPDRPGDALWAYPLVGVVVGGIGMLAFWAAHSLGTLPAAILAVTAQIFATGALHEDGLADTADGFGGGHTRERKLEIMRDSRVGSYGVLALVLVTLMRVVAVSTAPSVALIAAATLGRAAMVGILATTQAARNDGLAAGLADAPLGPVIAALGGAVVLTLVIAPHAAFGVISVAALSTGLMRFLAIRQIGGQTGDVLGATCLIVEVAVLTVLAA